MTLTDIPGGDEARGAEAGSELPRLTSAEDAELRQLAWFSKAGQLSAQSQARLTELRARDRRDTIRDPRPDPSVDAIRRAPAFSADTAGSSTCPNCGSGSLKVSGSSRLCSYCGFSQRHGPDTAQPADSPTSLPPRDQGACALGTIEGGAFRELLVTAARGGAPGVGN